MISLAASALHHMFQQVTPHMSDDDTLPVIHNVRIEARDGHLYAIATDRYTLAIARRVIVGDVDRAGYIPGALIPAVTEWLKGVAESGDSVSISWPADDVVAFSAPARGKLTTEFDLSDYAHYPDWRKIFREALTAEPGPVPVTGFNTSFLARWQHSAPKLAAWQTGPMKPLVLIDYDGGFIGMQMPYRTEETRAALSSEWLAAIERTATVDGIKYDLDKTWADVDGDSWTYSGKDMPDGMPLMVLDGIEDDPHPLARLIEQYGPLRAA
jgi:hypothetical protein